MLLRNYNISNKKDDNLLTIQISNKSSIYGMDYISGIDSYKQLTELSEYNNLHYMSYSKYWNDNRLFRSARRHKNKTFLHGQLFQLKKLSRKTL